MCLLKFLTSQSASHFAAATSEETWRLRISTCELSHSGGGITCIAFVARAVVGHNRVGAHGVCVTVMRVGCTLVNVCQRARTQRSTPLIAVASRERAHTPMPVSIHEPTARVVALRSKCLLLTISPIRVIIANSRACN